VPLKLVQVPEINSKHPEQLGMEHDILLRSGNLFCSKFVNSTDQYPSLWFFFGLTWGVHIYIYTYVYIYMYVYINMYIYKYTYDFIQGFRIGA
jgi:hypothetical protein